MRSPSLMKLVVLVLVGVVTSCCSPSAFADNIPGYSLTSGTVTLTPNFDLSGSIVTFSLTGPGGVTLFGFSDQTAVCSQIPSGTCGPGTSTQPLSSGDAVQSNAKGLSGKNLFSIGGITISSIGTVNLPPESTGTTMTADLPVIFSGTFAVCTLAQDGGGCASNPLANFTVDGKGIGIFQFTFMPGADNTGFWTLTSATFELTQTPEPSSLMLIGTGIICLGWKLSRRKATT